MKVSGSEIARHQGVLGLKHRNTKILFFFQNHLLQMLGIFYIALPGCPLSNLFKLRSQVLKWPVPGGFWFEP